MSGAVLLYCVVCQGAWTSDLLGTVRGHRQPNGGWESLGTVVNRQYIQQGRKEGGGKAEEESANEHFRLHVNARCTSNKVAIIRTLSTTLTSCCSVWMPALPSNHKWMASVRKEKREGQRGGLTTTQGSCLRSPCIELDPHYTLLSEKQKPMVKGNSWFGAGGEKSSGHYQSATCTAGGKLDVHFV